MTEVSAEDRHGAAGGAVVGQCEVAGAGAEVEDRPPLGWARRDELRGPGPPALVDVEAEQVVEEVVPRRDLAEHPLDAHFAFVE